MVKAIVALVLIMALYLFYPTYNLSVKTDPFATDYRAVASEFITLNRCRNAAEAMGAEAFRCEKKARWRGLFDTFRQRDPKIRALQREVAEP